MIPNLTVFPVSQNVLEKNTPNDILHFFVKWSEPKVQMNKFSKTEVNKITHKLFHENYTMPIFKPRSIYKKIDTLNF